MPPVSQKVSSVALSSQGWLLRGDRAGVGCWHLGVNVSAVLTPSETFLSMLL